MKCILCNFQTKWDFAFKQHLNKHKPIDPEFNCAGLLNPFNCCKCESKFRTKIGLIHHMNNHKESKTVEGSFKCRQCTTVSFKSFDLWKKHIIDYHIPKDDDWKVLKCQQCAFETRLQQALDQHVAENHGNLDWYKCNQCLFKTKIKKELTRHIMFNHLVTMEIQCLNCFECSFRTRSKMELREHMRNQHRNNNGRWHQCPSCYYKSQTKTDLKRHISLIHRRRRN